jgi:hypothetical protein
VAISSKIFTIPLAGFGKGGQSFLQVGKKFFSVKQSTVFSSAKKPTGLYPSVQRSLVTERESTVKISANNGPWLMLLIELSNTGHAIR